MKLHASLPEINREKQKIAYVGSEITGYDENFKNDFIAHFKDHCLPW